MLIRSKTFHMLFRVTMSFAVLICLCAVNIQAQTSSSVHRGIIYRNPRVYNIEYTFEMFPDPNKIDRSKDLKLWMPIPREWDSQKAVKIISVEPEPHAKYVDPEYGNLMLFWDFGKEPQKPSYKVSIRCRLEQYEVYTDIDPNRIGLYDKTSKDYILYTQSTNTISITDKVKELAKIAVGNEKKPYLQAKRIYEFVRKKMYYSATTDILRKRGRSIKAILEFPVIDQKTGQEYYIGDCVCHSAFFVALCRTVGIPARRVMALWDYRPWNRTYPEGLESATESQNSSANGVVKFFGAHVWAEIYLPNYGWIPVDPTFEGFGHSYSNKVVINCKGRDIRIGPDAPQEGSEGYGLSVVHPVHEGRIDGLAIGGGVRHISNMQRVEREKFHRPDPFPADALTEYAAKLYPAPEAEKNLALYRKCTLRWIDQNTREHTDKITALAQAYEKEPKARYEHQAFICHMLRKVVGDKKFSDIVEIYTDLRVNSGEPVSTAQFQKIAEYVFGQPLGWFFKQWIGYSELPQLQLDAVTFSETEKGWLVRGNLRQLNNSLFRLPVELVIETGKTTEHRTLWLEDGNTTFEIRTTNRPKGVLVDPNNDILQIREIPPLLEGSSYDEIAFCTITDQDLADLFSWTPLHFAAEAGQTDVVKFLIAKGADVNAENINGRTPLLFAAFGADKGHKEVVELLIENGADVSLYVAARLGDVARAKSLIEDGADVDAEMWGQTPLHAAATKGHKEIAELLIAEGAEVDANTPGYTPLTSAIWSDDRDIIKLLLKSGADVNFDPKNDVPAIYYSVWDVELAKLLLAHEAKLDVKDENGWTVFRHSVSLGNHELTEFFLSKGATAPEFHLAACMGNLERVKSLVEEVTDVDTKDEAGWTPLYWAVSMGREEVAEFLIGKGADINVKIDNGRTLLHQSA
ncbi:MAG: ankyrin repeat domain-containing protein, partial [Planctomycetes bacterium]|nr:ankyrin repeat domain-containing protein [Planctomycetota bacterium]